MPFAVLRKPDGALRGLLEFGRGNLPEKDVSAMTGIILQVELDRLKKELAANGAIGFSFDGSSNVAELLAIVVCFVTPDCTIQQRCVCLRMLERSLNAQMLFTEVVKVLMGDLNLNTTNLHCATRDGCPTNGAAMNSLMEAIPTLVDNTCLSHALDNCGKKFKETCPSAVKFLSSWSTIMNTSRNCALRFAHLSHESPLRDSSVRWFAWADLVKQIHNNLKHVVEIIHDADLGAPELRNRMVTQWQVEENTIRLELALVTDGAPPISAPCHVLEGDGFLAPLAYTLWHRAEVNGRRLTGRHAHGAPQLPDLPLTKDVCNVIAPDDAPRQLQLLKETAKKLYPIYDKLHDETVRRMQPTLHPVCQ